MSFEQNPLAERIIASMSCGLISESGGAPRRGTISIATSTLQRTCWRKPCTSSPARNVSSVRRRMTSSIPPDATYRIN